MALISKDTVINDVAEKYAAKTGDTTATYGNLADKVEAAIGGGGGFNWGDTITDDWDTIIANANAGTVSAYNDGDTKTVEFLYGGMPLAIQCMIVIKNHETISGTTDKAALTFGFKHRLLHNQMNASATNVGGWLGVDGDYYANSLDETGGELTYGCGARKFLYQLYKSFPSNLQTAIKTVDKIYDDSNGLQTAKDKLFLPCLEEVGGTYTNYRTGQGTAYSYFSGVDARKKNGIGQIAYWTRSRNTATQQFIVINGANSTISAAGASSFLNVCPCFCL